MLKLTVPADGPARLAGLEVRFGPPLGELQPSPQLLELLKLDAAAPLASSDAVRTEVRGLLRAGGFKASGRSKPASEYLLKAAADPGLASINLAVDLCNAVSLHSGLPISVVDLDLAAEPLSVATVSEKSDYLFNASGQTLDLLGLLCLWDAAGPCGSPVKDSQRTKTHAATRRVLFLIWGSKALEAQVVAAESWLRELVKKTPGQLLDVELVPG